MLRRTVLTALAGLIIRPTTLTSGQKVLAISTFGGQGSMTDIDTGLRYNGAPVSPSFVTITPYGYETSARVGVFPHQNDTLIDVHVSDGVTWVGKAEFIQ